MHTRQVLYHWIMLSTFNTVLYYMILVNGSLSQFKLYTSLVGKLESSIRNVFHKGSFFVCFLSLQMCAPQPHAELID